MRHRKIVLVLVLGLFASGCVTNLGPRTVRPERFNYNEVVAQSWNEQLLLNLVRSHYRDTTLFIEVSGITASHSFTGTGSLGFSLGLDTSAADGASPGASLSYTESPVITYTPLQGEAFARQLLSPISPETLAMLADTGWSLETLLLCCVEDLNDLHNASYASWPTPTRVPDYKDFHRASILLGELQDRGGIDVVTDATGASKIEVDAEKIDQMASQFTEVAKLLQLGSSPPPYSVIWDNAERKSGEIAIKGRSLFGVLSFLSNGVEEPAEHRTRGLVTITRDAAGQPFDWGKVIGRLMRIHSSKESPKGAYVKIRYRNHWFYIDDSDLTSKTTFGLVTYLFSLQSVKTSTVLPTITVSPGRP